MNPKIRSILTIFLTLVFATAGPTAALAVTRPDSPKENCSTILSPHGLSAETVAVLNNTKESFKFEVLTKVINGRQKTVVLAGETHVKSKVASERGRQLIEQFRLRGLEGANVNANWQTRAMLPIITAISFFSQKVLRLKGSTIGDARDADFDSRLSRDVARQFASAIRAKYGVNGSLVVTPEIENEISDLIAGGEFEFEDEKFRMGAVNYSFKTEKLFELIKSDLEEPMSTGADGLMRPESMNLRLEKGHQPDLHEKVGLLFMPSLVAASFVQYLSGHFVGHGLPAVDIVHATASGFSTLNMYYLFGYFGLRKWHYEKPWFKAVFVGYTGLLEGRNATMVKNINQGFIENEDHDTMLVLVGSFHVSGMRTLLIEKYGFSPASLESTPAQK
jgi:hypothetical protein